MLNVFRLKFRGAPCKLPPDRARVARAPMVADSSTFDFRRATLDELKFYVDANPQCVSEKDKITGRLPIHDLTAMSWANDTVAAAAKVAYLLALFPASALEKDAEGRLPIHCACFWEVPIEIFCVVHAASPTAAITLDSKGYRPLHYAIMHHQVEQMSALIDFETMVEQSCTLLDFGSMNEDGVSGFGEVPILHFAIQYLLKPDALRLLLRKLPNCAMKKNRFGNLPLHSSLYLKCDLETVELLIDAYPEALVIPNQNGSLPIHMEASVSARFAHLQKLCAVSPEGLSVKDLDGRLPIHRLLKNDAANMDSFVLMHSVYPCGLITADLSGNTPLHLYCIHYGDTKSIDMAWFLMNAPEAALIANKAGDFPLHRAMRNDDFSISMLTRLAECYPDALLVQDSLGHVPLNAAMYHRDREMASQRILCLLEAFPQITRATNLNGRTVMHALCRSHTFCWRDLATISFVVQHDPGLLSIYDNDGYLPFHWACCQNFSSKVLQYLLEKHRGKALPPSKDMVPPLFLACEANACLDIVVSLLQHSMDLFSRLSEVSESPVGESSTTWKCECQRCKINEEICQRTAGMGYGPLVNSDDGASSF